MHYHPFEEKTEEEWFEWHNDYSILTALTSAMYLDGEGKEFAPQTGGLFCKNRFSEAARVQIPENMLAIQLGECAEIFTGGHFQATPHSVAKSREIGGRNISRNTYGLFIEPSKLEKMSVPRGINPEWIHHQHPGIPEMKARWKNGITFREFEKNSQELYVP